MPPRLPLLRPLLPLEYRIPPRFLAPVITRGYAAKPATPIKVIKPILDEAIKPRIVNFVDRNGKFHIDQSVSDLLNQIDRRTEHIQWVNAQAKNDTTPLCKIITKEAIRNQAKAKYEKAKEERIKAKEERETKPLKTNVLKEVELSWAISSHDLGHRMKKILEFLEKGYKVELTFGTKKGMQKQHLETMENLVENLRKNLARLGKEWAEPQGSIGRRYTLYYRGRGPQDEPYQPEADETSEEVIYEDSEMMNNENRQV
ncbi:hypothetical protein EDC01DRAFT_657821 [Geopyxis carbonaria]|nr:hypothetical protein EDC01DRAFT_657821 [Geopyxis carbonaria]